MDDSVFPCQEVLWGADATFDNVSLSPRQVQPVRVWQHRRHRIHNGWVGGHCAPSPWPHQAGEALDVHFLRHGLAPGIVFIAGRDVDGSAVTPHHFGFERHIDVLSGHLDLHSGSSPCLLQPANAGGANTVLRRFDASRSLGHFWGLRSLRIRRVGHHLQAQRGGVGTCWPRPRTELRQLPAQPASFSVFWNLNSCHFDANTALRPASCHWITHGRLRPTSSSTSPVLVSPFCWWASWWAFSATTLNFMKTGRRCSSSELVLNWCWSCRPGHGNTFCSGSLSGFCTMRNQRMRNQSIPAWLSFCFSCALGLWCPSLSIQRTRFWGKWYVRASRRVGAVALSSSSCALLCSSFYLAALLWSLCSSDLSSKCGSAAFTIWWQCPLGVVEKRTAGARRIATLGWSFGPSRPCRNLGASAVRWRPSALVVAFFAHCQHVSCSQNQELARQLRDLAGFAAFGFCQWVLLNRQLRSSNRKLRKLEPFISSFSV